MDLDKLKSEIREAAKRGREYFEQKLAQAESEKQNEKALNLKIVEEEAKRREEKKRADELARADEILAELPKRVERATERGERNVHVMFLKALGASDFRPDFFNGLFDHSSYSGRHSKHNLVTRFGDDFGADDLVSVAKLVFEGCEKVGKPYIYCRTPDYLWGDMSMVGVLHEGFEMRLVFDRE